MSENVMEVMRRTFPKSVQPGLPKLKPPKPGWKSCRFGELLDQVQRRVHLQPDDTYDLVTVKRSRGGIESRGKLRGSQISVTSQFRIAAGDFLISKRQIVHGACGAVSSEFDGAVVSNEYSVLRCKPNIDLTFLQYLSHSVYFQQTCFHSSIGVHIEKMIFKLDEWFKWPVNIPTLPEQKKIAAFLGAVDAKLAALAAKQAALGRFKAGLMQKLFTQQLRFTRDDGKAFPDWQDKRLGEIGGTYSGLSGKSGDDFGEGLPFVTYRQVFEDAAVDFSRCARVRVGPKEKQNLVLHGDVLVTTSSETPNEVGFTSVVLQDPPKAYLNSFCFGFRYSQKNLSPKFAAHLFRSPPYRKEVVVLAQGSTRYNISKSGFLALKLNFPHPDEQRKIASALSSLDAKISAVSRQISQMEAFKKGLLQQMFV